MDVKPATAPRPPRGRGKVRWHVPRIGVLLLMVLLSAACTSVARAHEQDPSDHGSDQYEEDGQGQEGQEDEGGSDSVVVVNGLETLGRSCDHSRLERHHGFQEAPRCAVTEMGEIPTAENGPQLLITSAPRSVAVGESFTLRVSSRNLVRDRFLGAADGGYYLESAFLNDEGLVRGHFHTACRILSDGVDAAPDPAAAVSSFEATEDGDGGREPDEVEIEVPGFSEPGLAQCAAWAGDGSHRIPMMESAQQIPAFDTVIFPVG